MINKLDEMTPEEIKDSKEPGVSWDWEFINSNIHGGIISRLQESSVCLDRCSLPQLRAIKERIESNARIQVIVIDGSAVFRWSPEQFEMFKGAFQVSHLKRVIIQHVDSLGMEAKRLSAWREALSSVRVTVHLDVIGKNRLELEREAKFLKILHAYSCSFYPTVNDDNTVWLGSLDDARNIINYIVSSGVKHVSLGGFSGVDASIIYLFKKLFTDSSLNAITMDGVGWVSYASEAELKAWSTVIADANLSKLILRDNLFADSHDQLMQIAKALSQSRIRCRKLDMNYFYGQAGQLCAEFLGGEHCEEFIYTGELGPFVTRAFADVINRSSSIRRVEALYEPDVELRSMVQDTLERNQKAYLNRTFKYAGKRGPHLYHPSGKKPMLESSKHLLGDNSVQPIVSTLK